MVKRERLINKLRQDLDYTYTDETDKIVSYRKRGGTHVVVMRRKGNFSDDYVLSVLKQCGVEEQEREAFVAANQA